jgi:hypothetical protein
LLSGGSWEAPSNNANNKYRSRPSEVYSISPAIGVGPAGRLHVIYMEGQDNFQPTLPATVFDIIYNGTSELKPPIKIFLPLILKNSS